MAVIRQGKNAVLLVVDVQVGVLRNVWDDARIINNIDRLLEKARSQAIPVIWVQHSDEELVYESPDWEIVPELSPAEGEERIFKHFNSSFEQTSLDETLEKLEATHIILAGAATNWCIRATAYGALDRGYDLTLIEDAHSTETIEIGESNRIEAADIVQELNIVMNWVSYPGLTNRTVPVDEVEFEGSESV